MNGLRLFARCFGSRTLRLLALSLEIVVLVVLGHSAPLLALDRQTPSQWEWISPNGTVSRFFVTRTGTVYAQAGDGFWRSDDDGTSWAKVELPRDFQPLNAVSDDLVARTRPLAVDPDEPDSLFATDWRGVVRSRDGGGSWTLVFPLERKAYQGTPAIAVSEADHRLIYFAPEPGTLWRSRDGGDAWNLASYDNLSTLACPPRLALLRPHPTDPSQVARALGSTCGSARAYPLAWSHDQGATWASSQVADAGHPVRLLGNSSAMPGRLYAQLELVMARGWSFYRSDDYGLTWQQLDTPTSVKPATATAPKASSLAFDAARPDRVWVGGALSAGRVLVSADGGMTWSDGGLDGTGGTFDLALQPERQLLYAATPNGVWRRRADE